LHSPTKVMTILIYSGRAIRMVLNGLPTPISDDGTGLG